MYDMLLIIACVLAMTNRTNSFNRSTMLISVLTNLLNSTLLMKTVLWSKRIQVLSKLVE